jgi:hypothetical protein
MLLGKINEQFTCLLLQLSRTIISTAAGRFLNLCAEFDAQASSTAIR